jgi:hypothetical protein
MGYGGNPAGTTHPDKRQHGRQQTACTPNMHHQYAGTTTSNTYLTRRQDGSRQATARTPDRQMHAPQPTACTPPSNTHPGRRHAHKRATCTPSSKIEQQRAPLHCGNEPAPQQATTTPPTTRTPAGSAHDSKHHASQHARHAPGELPYGGIPTCTTKVYTKPTAQRKRCVGAHNVETTCDAITCIVT